MRSPQRTVDAVIEELRPMLQKNKIIGYVIVFLAFLVVYDLTLSSRARTGFRNQKNSYHVSLGMSKQAALAIMGRADTRGSRGRDSVFVYAAHQLASDPIAIIVGPANIVIAVNHGG